MCDDVIVAGSGTVDWPSWFFIGKGISKEIRKWDYGLLGVFKVMVGAAGGFVFAGLSLVALGA